MKFPVWATFFTALGIAILCGLGVWQLQRLEWKTGLIAQIDAAYHTDPMSFELTARHLANLPEDRLFVRGFAEGAYLNGKELLLGPRTHGGKPGYHVITPFETLDHHILLVNRGWVPLGAKEKGFSRPDGPLIVTGTARKPAPQGRFTPDNEPGKGAWFWLDLDAIATAKKLDNILPYVLYADAPTPSRPYPVAEATKPELPNNHRSYAFFWFTMAGLLALIYGLRFFPRKGR